MSKVDKMLEKDLKEAMKEVMKKEMQICKPESTEILKDLLDILAGNKPLTVDEISNVKEKVNQIGVDFPELDNAISSLSEDKRTDAIQALLSGTKSYAERMRICFEHDSTQKIEKSIDKIEKALGDLKKALKKS